MIEKTILKRVQALDRLTASEAKIADFFSRNYAELAFENVTSIGVKSGVSKATVVRFIAKLGYGSFSDFHNALRNESRLTHDNLHIRYSLKQKSLAEGEEDLLAASFRNIVKNLEATHTRIDAAQFMEIARMIANSAGKLYITGERSSHALAFLFHNMIWRIREDALLVASAGTAFPDALMDVSGGDLLFAIFRHPYATQTVSIARHFAARGAKIILLTDSGFSPLSETADHQLTVNTEGVATFTSSVAVVSVLESLNEAALKFAGGNVAARLEKAERLYSDFGVFWPK